jgi:hypothetical protein
VVLERRVRLCDGWMVSLWSLLLCLLACLPAVSSGGSGGLSGLNGMVDVQLGLLHRCGCQRGMDPWTLVLVTTDGKSVFVSRRETGRGRVTDDGRCFGEVRKMKQRWSGGAV